MTNINGENHVTPIKLLKPHTHSGRDYPPGAEITVTDAQAQWLIALGVARTAPPATAHASAKQDKE